MHAIDSYHAHLAARRLRARMMQAAWRQLVRAIAVRLRGLLGQLAAGLRLAA